MQFYTKGYLPVSFNNVWFNNASRYQQEFVLQLRNRENIHIPFARLTSSSTQPLVNLPRTWCQFPNENIKILRNKLEFKAEFKKGVGIFFHVLHVYYSFHQKCSKLDTLLLKGSKLRKGNKN
jgi:hypothetical protein